MAYHNYKLVRDIIPDFIIEQQGGYYEGSCDYDGDLWCAAADYINYLLNKIKELEDERSES